jgi:hypothetical protein
MKVYKAKLKAGTDVNCFSIVLGAAVQTKLSKFANEVLKPVFFANQEKRIIYSVAMRPNKEIYRKDINGEPGYITFDAEEVEKMQQSYFKSNNKGLTKMSLNHSDETVTDVYPIESWIVLNPELDKSKTLLMEDVQAGDLILGFKIENDDVWENFVKTGEVDGISLEAFLDYEIINPIINMTKEEKKENFFTHLMNFFAVDEAAGTPDPLAAGTPDPLAAGTPDPLAELQTMYDAVVAENADLKEKLATMQAKDVKDATTLETMKSQKAKAENDLAVFKAEKLAIQNLPNEKSFAEMTALEKYRESKKNQ